MAAQIVAPMVTQIVAPMVTQIVAPIVTQISGKPFCTNASHGTHATNGDANLFDIPPKYSCHQTIQEDDSFDR